jgi:serine/threonine-protein kinase
VTDPTAPADRPDVPGHRLLRVIGQGSSASVWSAIDPSGRPVAIKVPHAAPDAVEVRQGEIERHVLTAVRHEHLVPLRDVVPLADGRVALVFDLVVGATLRSMVQVRGHLRPGEAVTLITPLAEAVAVLHAAGGTHCDISAGNVMVTADGRPMLMDLGSARLAGAGAGATVGTPGFVAPEVREGDPPTEASDVFSLGALAWFCLTGNGAPDTMLRLSPETVLSHVGEELAEVIGACIDPEPQRRPASSVLAARFYHAATAEPIEVVVGADDASALTHRLRAEASRGGMGPPPGHPTRRCLPSVRRKERGGEGHLAPTPGRPSGTGQAPGRPWFRVAALGGRRWPRRVGTGAVIALLALLIGGLVHLGALPWTGPRPLAVTSPSPGPPPDPLSVDGPSRSARPSSGGTTRAAAPAGEQAAAVTQLPEPLRSRAAVTEQTRAVIQALTDLRVQALTTRDATRLISVHVKDSPSFDVDAGVIEQLHTRGQRYVGLTMTVGRASHLSGGPTRAVIRARVDIAAYDVVSDDGVHTEEPATRGEVLDFSLVWQSDGWRLESVSEPAST